MGSILHDARHAKDLKQQPIRDKIELVGQFSGYESGQAAGEIISEIVSFIGPAKLAKIAGKSKLVSRLSQVPKIEKGLSYIKQARTMLSDNYLSTLARESYGTTKDFFRSRLGNLWDDFSRTKFAFAGLDDFHYADDIGKHTARLYQSTGEGAEYQRIRRGLYSEADEVGRNLRKSQTRNWIDEASEILTDGSHMDGKVPKPNVVYEAGEHRYIYRTDEVGRIDRAYAEDLQLKLHEDRLRHNSNTLDKEIGDHAGRIFGDLFGGSPELDNLVSQAKDVNLKEYRRIERDWADALKSNPPKKVEVDIKINYEGSSMRPSSFEVNYKIDGKKYNEIIPNINR